MGAILPLLMGCNALLIEDKAQDSRAVVERSAYLLG